MNILSRLFLILLVAVCEMTTISDTTYAQNPTPIATFEREEVGGGAFGYFMESADVNGDGVDDFLVSDGYYDGEAGVNSGRVYVFFGRTFYGSISASDAEIKIDGIQPQQITGTVRTGNIDGDEFADIVLGTINYYDSAQSYNSGRVYVFYGNSIRTGGSFTVNQADLIFYADTLSSRLDVSTLCDFDSDGLDDVLLYNFARDGFQGQNKLSVFYAQNLSGKDSILLSSADALFTGTNPQNTYSYLFCNVCTDNLHLDDLTADGYPDLVATYFSPGSYFPDTLSIIYGQPGGFHGTGIFQEGDVMISGAYDHGGYGQTIIPFIADFDGDNESNLVVRNPLFHFDPVLANRYGRVYMFKNMLTNGMALEDASSKIRGTITGIFSGNFGLRMDFGDVNEDGINEMAVADYGYGLAGAQFLFRGREEWPDSLSDMDANVKIFGNANYSGLSNGVMLGDIMGTGKAQWLLAYDQKGSRTDGFVDLYPSSVLTGIEEPVPNPRSLVLHPNYPNPFNPSTTISYELPSAGHVELSVYNVLGQEVRRLVNSNVPSGYHKVIWNGKNDQGRNVASGIYIVMLQFGNDVKTRKIMLLK